MNRTEFGTKIKELRQNAALTLKELSEASGVSITNISKIERGVYNPSLEIMNKILDALNCCIEIIEKKNQE